LIRFIKLICVGLLFSFSPVWGQQISVFATTDSIEYTIGDYIKYQLQLKYDNNLEIVYPSVKDSIDVIEFIREATSSKNEVNQKIVEIKNYIFSKYDSAEVVIPSLTVEYRVKGDTELKKIKTNPVTISVKTLEIDSQADIQDVKSPLKIPFDWIFWGIFFLILFLALAISYYFFKKYKLKKEGVPVKKVRIILPPHKIALNELRELEKSKLWQQGLVKDYHFRITYIIRKYFEGRFKFDALEMPSSEVLEKLERIPESNGIFDTAIRFFENADLVKFAKFQPMPTVNDEMMEQAFSIVKKTLIESESHEEIAEERVNV
jgi:hypothetical protein